MQEIVSIKSQQRCQKAELRLKAAQHERNQAICAILETRAMCAEMDDAPCEDALDAAAREIALAREAYCAALYAYTSAKRLLEHTRTAFAAAQNRLDTLALDTANHDQKMLQDRTK